MELRGFKMTALRCWADPGVNCAERPWKLPGLLPKVLPREVRNARSLNPRWGEMKSAWRVGGAERNRTADEGFADPCWYFSRPCLCGYPACLSHSVPTPRYAGYRFEEALTMQSGNIRVNGRWWILTVREWVVIRSCARFVHRPLTEFSSP